jgi:hypothetical protein
MRSRIIIAALAIVAMMAATVSAQVPAKPVDIYIGGGLSIPTGTVGDFWKMGFHGNGKIGFAAGPNIDILGSIAYHSFPLDDQGFSGVEGGTLTTILIGGDVRLSLGVPAAPTHPYLFGGGGLGLVSVSDVTFPGSPTESTDSESKPYVEFGGGVEMQRFFAEVKYVVVMTSDESVTFLPITIGVKF